MGYILFEISRLSREYSQIFREYSHMYSHLAGYAPTGLSHRETWVGALSATQRTHERTLHGTLLFSFQSARYVNLGFKHRLQKAANREKQQGESPLRAQRRPRPAEYSRIFSCCANLGIFAENITKVSPRPNGGPMRVLVCF